MFYTFSFYDIFLLYLHCLYLSFFACSNKIKLKDFCRIYVKTSILKCLGMGLFDVNDDHDVSNASWKAFLGILIAQLGCSSGEVMIELALLWQIN